MAGAPGDSCDGDCGCGTGACRIAAPASPLPTLDPASWDVRRRRAVRRAAAGRAAGRSGTVGLSVLVLDVGGVVIPSLFESVGVPGFPAGPLTGETAWGRVQAGEVTERDYWKGVADERPSLDIEDLWRRCSAVRDELRVALDALTGRVRMAAFTNDMAHFFGTDWPTRFPEMQAFDVIVEAAQLNVHKPDPEAFLAAADVIGESPERCLFVDDLAVNIDGARRAGMAGRLFDVRDPAGSIQAVLDDLGIADHHRPEPTRAFRTPSAGSGAGHRTFAVTPSPRPAAGVFRRGTR